MGKKLFSKQEVKQLSTNKYVRAVSKNGITYTDEFKRLFITEDESGKFPRQIFEEFGFDSEVLGARRMKSSADRWRAAYKEKGLDGLRDNRKGKSGRSTNRELTLEEKYKRLEAQNNLLKAENELLKKLEMMERGKRTKTNCATEISSY